MPLTDEDIKLANSVGSVMTVLHKRLFKDAIKYLIDNPEMKFDGVETGFDHDKLTYVIKLKFIER